VTCAPVHPPTRFLFFTGKGGVGKTSSSAPPPSPSRLADAGRRVLLVSTDAASNLDEMLGVPLSNQPVAVPGVPGLSVLNIDPDVAAEAYRQRVLAQLGPDASDGARPRCASSSRAPAPPRSPPSTSSRACSRARAEARGRGVGPRRLRHGAHRPHAAPAQPAEGLERLLAGNDRGASCLGPHSGLKMQEARFNAGARRAERRRPGPPWCS
jgi:arsenite-transporting ATPase